MKPSSGVLFGNSIFKIVRIIFESAYLLSEPTYFLSQDYSHFCWRVELPPHGYKQPKELPPIYFCETIFHPGNGVRFPTKFEIPNPNSKEA